MRFKGVVIFMPRSAGTATSQSRIADDNANDVSFLSDDSKVKTDVGFERNIFLHINRLGVFSMLPGREQEFLDGVEVLDAYLSGDTDELYEEQMLKLRVQTARVLSTNCGAIAEDPGVERSIIKRYGLSWLRILMRLMKRKGFTPQSIVTDEF